MKSTKTASNFRHNLNLVFESNQLEIILCEITKRLNFVNWIKCEIYKAKDYSFTLLAKVSYDKENSTFGGRDKDWLTLGGRGKISQEALFIFTVFSNSAG